MDKELLAEIDQLNDLLPNKELLEDELLICECFCVSVADIRALCQEDMKVDLDLLNKTYGMGDGCKSCVGKVNTWINKIY